jgi:AraC family transcriptional regulator, regulatory protein of adaptative response / DNA-3-methyladenine glycosylase II
MNPQGLLERAFTGDSSLDGLFVVGVRTTRIYCRPSCKPPKRPKLEHRELYANPLAAQKAGFRACKLCRPDGIAPVERERLMVNALTKNALEFSSVAEMAASALVSESKLYKLFRLHRDIVSRQLGSAKIADMKRVTPLEVLNRVRVEAACKRLEGSDEPVSRIALEVGFQSLSAFNANFKRFMQVSPLEYRKHRTLLEAA